MAGKRMVYEQMCESIKFSKVSAEAERLWTRILTKTDDNGNFHASPALVRGLCLPQFDYPLADVTKWIEELADVGLVLYYEVRGETFLHIAGFFKYQTLRKDRKMTVRYPAHPESLDENVTGPPTDLDDDFVDEPVSPVKSTVKPTSVLVIRDGKPLVNQPPTTGKPVVTVPPLEVKIREEKISEVNVTGAALPASLEKQKTSGGDWKTFAIRCRRHFGKIPAGKRDKDTYAEACFTYGEEVVLAAFEEWAPGAGWVKEKGYDPLRQFIKVLPDYADVLAGAKELEEEETRQVNQAVEKAKETEVQLQQQIAAARKRDADQWDSMTKPSANNEISLEDFLAVTIPPEGQ